MDRTYIPQNTPPDSSSGSTWNGELEYLLEAYSRLARSSDPAVRTQGRSSIDEDLSSLDAIHRSLRSRRNRLVPVNTLPPESLSIIFRFLAELWLPHNDRGLGWIQVTHVCQRWRAVACQDATLWAAAINCVPLNEEWSLEMIRRMKSLPFRFTSSRFLRSRIQLPFAKSLLKYHLNHIKDMLLEIAADVMADILPILSSVATCLETITLKADFSDLDLFLPLDALCSNAPVLRVVELENVSICCDSRISDSSGLEELSIKVRSWDNPTDTAPPESFCRSSALALASILSVLPNLKVLQLSDSLPSSTDSFGCLASIHLPRLSLLEIKGTIAECKAIMGVLTPSPDCTLRVSCYVQLSENASHLTPILIRAGAYLSCSSHLLPIESFSVYADDEHVICLSGWRPSDEVDPDSDDEADSDGNDATFAIRLYFECDVYESLRNISALWNIMHAKLPLQETSYLFIQVARLFDHGESYEDWIWRWIDQFAPFTAVTRCQVCDLIPEHSLDLFSALGRMASREPLPFLLPSLTWLQIDFGCRHDDDEIEDDDKTCADWLQYRSSLIDALRQRKEDGFGIEGLVLTNWIVDPEFEGQLKLIVPEVELQGPHLRLVKRK